MTPVREPFTHAVLAVVVLGLFGLSYVLPYFVAIPAGQGGVLIVGAAKVIETIVVLVLGYYFGSSRGSARKEQILGDQLSKQAGAAAAASLLDDAARSLKQGDPPNG